MTEQKPEPQAAILISRAPDDPDEKAAWANQMARIQFAMWVDDGAKCAQCGLVYKSVDDFIARDPRAGGKDWDTRFVDTDCWAEWESSHG